MDSFWKMHRIFSTPWKHQLEHKDIYHLGCYCEIIKDKSDILILGCFILTKHTSFAFVLKTREFLHKLCVSF